MKNINIIFGLMLLLNSCNFLEEEPKDFLSPLNFYQTEGDAVAAINSIYNHLASGGYYGSNMWQIGERPTDNLLIGAVNRDDQTEIHDYTFNGNTSYFPGVWQELYSSIKNANAAIERIPSIEMNESLKKRLIAEAKFLRGLNYFDLARIFGDVPLVINETRDLEDLFIKRDPVNDVYAQAIKDISEAEQELPESYSSSNIGRATKGAAKALLARVYLYMEDYEMAAQKAEEVMNLKNGTQPLYGLLPIENLWDVENKNSKEHIFSVQYKSGVQGSGYSGLFAIRGAKAPITGFSTAYVSQDLIEAYESEDKRKDVSILSSYNFPDGTSSNFEPHVWKFFDPSAITPTDGNTNWPIIRYAEVLLIKAEAEARLNGSPNQDAYDAINEVRNRAGLEDLPQGLSLQDFIDAVINERRLELAFEGHRYFDLKRTNKLVSVLSAYGLPVVEKHYLFPIPQRELDANPALEQNDGY